MASVKKKMYCIFEDPQMYQNLNCDLLHGTQVSPGGSGPRAKIRIGTDGLNAALSSGMTTLHVMFA